MDPDANLEEQLEIAKRLADGTCYPEGEDYIEDANRLCELVLALDEWLRHGGFLPHPWSKR